MRILTLTLLASGFIGVAAPAMAASCYDLWYERNAIYNDNGFCFQTQLGRDTFDNSDCYTSHPSLSASEQKRVNWLRRQERMSHCKVNQ
jgi:YARHG domain